MTIEELEALKEYYLSLLNDEYARISGTMGVVILLFLLFAGCIVVGGFLLIYQSIKLATVKKNMAKLSWQNPNAQVDFEPLLTLLIAERRKSAIWGIVLGAILVVFAVICVLLLTVVYIGASPILLQIDRYEQILQEIQQQIQQLQATIPTMLASLFKV